MPKYLVTDERQKDTKSREFAQEMGIDRHERQHWSMDYIVRQYAECQTEIVRRLCEKVRNLGIGSYAASTLRGKTVKVTRVEFRFIIEVRERGKESRLWAVWDDTMSRNPLARNMVRPLAAPRGELE